MFNINGLTMLNVIVFTDHAEISTWMYIFELKRYFLIFKLVKSYLYYMTNTS